MHKILIFGNSGSGKSTLAKELANSENLAHLDLDSLAWLPIMPPERTPLEMAKRKIQEFTKSHSNWVIEGCYTDLLEIAISEASELIFMNLTVEQCIENAKNRPREPHKYTSKAAQDKNLEMLINWIEQYPERDDVFSHKAHMDLYQKFPDKKIMYTNNQRNTQ